MNKKIKKIEELAEALKKLDYMVIADLWLTPTARYADIVLPVTSIAEKSDLARPWPSGPYFLYVNQAIDPLGECKSDLKIAEELADKLLLEAEKVIPGLREHSKTEVIMTPLDFKSRIFVEKHSFGGLAPIMNQQNPPHQTPIQNLWYVGAQSESGGGVAGVVAGTRKSILKMLREIKN